MVPQTWVSGREHFLPSKASESGRGSGLPALPRRPRAPAASAVEDVAQDCDQYQEQPAGVGDSSPEWGFQSVVALRPLPHVTELRTLRQGSALLPLLRGRLFRSQSGAWLWLQATEHIQGLPRAALGHPEHTWKGGSRQRSGGADQDPGEERGCYISVVSPAGRPTASL